LLASGVLVSGVLVSGVLACGGTEAELTPAPAGCGTNDECAEQQVCQASVCVQGSSVSSRSAGDDACAVVSCPESNPACCSGAVATATGNGRQSYSPQLHMLQHVGSEGGAVRADFMFDAPNQQGWVTFELGGELELSRLELTAFHDGVADRYLSLNTNQLDRGGCAFAFELAGRSAPEGSPSPLEFAQVKLNDDDNCYGGGHPGRASELAFAIFSLEPGPASLSISSLQLTSE
jgi:hypothetical protein